MPDLDPDTDPFRPPRTPTVVGCLHCHQVYDSYQIEWRTGADAAGKPWGFWCCPTPGCGGAGFGCDILPVDRDWVDEDGNRMWVDDGGDEDEYEEYEEPDPGEGPPPGSGADDDTDIPW